MVYNQVTVVNHCSLYITRKWWSVSMSVIS